MKNIATEELVQSWRAFYRDLFEINTDFTNLRIPAHREGFDRLIIVAQGMDPERLYHKCREFFLGWKVTNKGLDEVVRSDRSSKNGPYAVWCRETNEADEDLKNLSADDLKAKGVPCLTLEERLLYELKFFNETSWHLDPDTFTLCAGSRYTDGYVPTVRYRVTAVGLGIHWYKTEDRFAAVRARIAIV
jgi:hypothetical protein